MCFAPIDTERLLLDRLRPGDAEAVSRLADDPEVARYTANIPIPYTPVAAASWITSAAREMATGRSFIFALRRREDARLIGAIGASVADEGVEIGYWLGRAYWGRGYATEATRRMVDFAFHTLGASAAFASVHRDNPASMRVLEKAGFTFRGFSERLFPARAAMVEVAVYAIEEDVEGPAGDPVVLVAAAALVDDSDRVLLCERPAGKPMAGLWEFPGGKVRRGETVSSALVRELEEELGVVVTASVLEPLTVASHRYESFHLLMPLQVCRTWSGEPRGLEGQRLAWVALADLDDYSMLPADMPLVKELKRTV